MTATTSDSRGGLSGHDTPPLVVSVTEEPFSWVVEVRGELDIFTFPLVKHHLDIYKDKSGTDAYPEKIVFSLPDLTFIDASGLRAILTAADGHGPETITIRNPSSQVRRLLELVDLDSMIEPTSEPTEGNARLVFGRMASALLSVDLLKHANEVVVHLG